MVDSILMNVIQYIKKSLLIISKAQIRRQYFKGVSLLNYEAAARWCSDRGSTLATILTKSDWNEARSVCNEVFSCWIGLRDDVNDDDEMIWSWIDGSRISNSYGFYPNGTATTGQEPWDINQPNEWKGWEQDCAALHSASGKYWDFSCDIKFYPLCSVSVST